MTIYKTRYKIVEKLPFIDELRNYKENNIIPKFVLANEIEPWHEDHSDNLPIYFNETITDQIFFDRGLFNFKIFVNCKIHDVISDDWRCSAFIDCDIKNVGIRGVPYVQHSYFYDTKLHNVIFYEDTLEIEKLRRGWDKHFVNCYVTHDDDGVNKVKSLYKSVETKL